MNHRVIVSMASVLVAIASSLPTALAQAPSLPPASEWRSQQAERQDWTPAMQAHKDAFYLAKGGQAIGEKFAAAILDPSLTDVQAWRLSQELLASPDCPPERWAQLYEAVATAHAGGYPPPWSISPQRRGMIRRVVVGCVVQTGVPAVMSSAGRELLKFYTLERLGESKLDRRVGEDPRVEFATMVNAWSGWTVEERKAFALACFANEHPDRPKRGAEILGRIDDGLEDAILSRATDRWRADGVKDWGNIFRLINRFDIRVADLIDEINKAQNLVEPRSSTGADVDKGEQGAFWFVTLLRSSKDWKLDYLANNPAGSAAYGYGGPDEDRMYVAKAALAQGASVAEVRDALILFYSKLPKSGVASPTPSAPWSRDPAKSMKFLRKTFVQMGVLLPTDWPDVQ